MTEDRPGGLELLLSLPATTRLLTDWLGASTNPPTIAAAASSPETESARAFSAIYQCLLQALQRDPAQALAAVRHLTSARLRLSKQERAFLLRIGGHAQRGVGRAGDACVSYARASKLLRTIGNRGEEGKTTIGWVFALGLAGRPAEALRVARRGRTLIPSSDPLSRARLESNLGTAWHLAGRFERAADRYQAAHEVFRRAQSGIDAATTALNLGLLRMMLGEVDRARDWFERALTVFTDRPEELLRLYAETLLTMLDLREGEWRQSMRSIDTLRRRFRERGDRRAEAWLHRELALFFSSLGAIELAGPEASSAYETFRELGLETDAAHAAGIGGRLLSSSGNAQAAYFLLDQARRHWIVSKNDWALRRTDLELARQLIDAEQPARAMPILRRSTAFLQRRDRFGDGALARSLSARGYLALGQPRRALRAAERAFHDSRCHPAWVERPMTALVAARASAAIRDHAAARRWLRRAVRTLEEMLSRFGPRYLRVMVGDARERIYSEAIDLVLGLRGEEDLSLALDLLSRGRMPILLEDLASPASAGLDRQTRAALVRLRDEWHSGASAIEVEGTRTRELRRQLARLERRLAGRPRAQTRNGRTLRARTPEQWKRGLGDRDLVLFDRGQEWRAFVVRAGGDLGVISLPDADAALQASWRTFRLTVETATHLSPGRRERFLSRTLSDSLSQLDRLRLAFLAPLGIEGRNALFVPHRDLHSLPLESLVAPGSSLTRLLHPSLLRPEPRLSSRRALLLHGAGEGAAMEVAEVATLLRAAGFQVSTADRRAALEGQRESLGLLHVAAHGRYHADRPILTGLELKDGWLGFEQLRRSVLRHAMVHFSSCQSGLAARTPGSDIEGWITAATAAGVCNMALTAWRVDDESSLLFSRAFYTALAGEDRVLPAAARARAELQAARPHPFHWASYMIVA